MIFLWVIFIVSVVTWKTGTYKAAWEVAFPPEPEKPVEVLFRFKGNQTRTIPVENLPPYRKAFTGIVWNFDTDRREAWIFVPTDTIPVNTRILIHTEPVKLLYYYDN